MNQPTRKEKMETILLFGSSRATAMLIIGASRATAMLIIGVWLSISAHAQSLEISLNKPEWQKDSHVSA